MMTGHDLDRDTIFILDQLITGKKKGACTLKELLLFLAVSATTCP